MIAPEEAWRRLEAALAEVPTPEPVRVPLAAARDRTLAAAVRATGDLPSADISALDGFAFAGDPGVERDVPVAGTTLAGDPAGSMPAGAARRIMTGAPLPAGADRVLGFENVELKDGVVWAKEAVAAGAAVRRRGEIVRAGDAILSLGDRLTPAALALLASQGIDTVAVAPLPAVELVVTGDEVVRGGPVAPGGVRDSHSDFLSAELARFGIEPLGGEPVGDARDRLTDRLGRALERAEVVLTTGGVSMGDADLVPSVLSALGCETLLHGLAIQPGKPLLAARRGTRFVFGLPGNPGSVMTSWWLFVRPLVARLAGRDPGGRGGFWSDAEVATLQKPLGAGRARDRFVPARLAVAQGRLRATPVSPRGSHDLVAFARADALLRVRAADPPRVAGDEVELLRVV